jgi:sialic acid synthase
MRELTIAGRRIADDTPCYVIAEIGHNHQGSLETCKAMFRAAKDCGADAVKLQKRDNRSLFTRDMYDSPYNSENAYAPTYGAHREALEFGWTEYVELQECAQAIGITFFATAFDETSAEFLYDLGMPAFKIASGDLTCLPLIEKIAAYKRPVILSTGAATLPDVRRAVTALGDCPHAILQCTSGYPAEFSELNLRVIQSYRTAFPDAVIGLSGHDAGIAMAPVAYTLGARVVEKHFTLNRAMKGTDHAFSLEPVGLRKMVRDLERTRVALGDGIKRTYESEEAPMLKMRKTLINGEWRVGTAAERSRAVSKAQGCWS